MKPGMTWTEAANTEAGATAEFAAAAVFSAVFWKQLVRHISHVRGSMT